jgi:hypothetical protein
VLLDDGDEQSGTVALQASGNGRIKSAGGHAVDCP